MEALQTKIEGSKILNRASNIGYSARVQRLAQEVGDFALENASGDKGSIGLYNARLKDLNEVKATLNFYFWAKGKVIPIVFGRGQSLDVDVGFLLPYGSIQEANRE